MIFYEHVLLATQLGRWKYIRFKITKGNSEDLKHVLHNIHLVKYIMAKAAWSPFRPFPISSCSASHDSFYPLLIVTIFITAEGFECILFG